MSAIQRTIRAGAMLAAAMMLTSCGGAAGTTAAVTADTGKDEAHTAMVPVAPAPSASDAAVAAKPRLMSGPAQVSRVLVTASASVDLDSVEAFREGAVDHHGIAQVASGPYAGIYLAYLVPNESNQTVSLRVRKAALQGQGHQEVVTGVTDSGDIATGLKMDGAHSKPSIAIDKNGYVHVTGGMHNRDEWAYFISKAPGNVTAGFRSAPPPGQGITYPYFFKDLKDDLWLTYRHKISPLSKRSSQGASAGAIVRYNTNGTWTAFGGSSYTGELAFTPIGPTAIWENEGGVDGHYQSFKTKLFFDRENRMHITWIVYTGDVPKGSDSDNATHVMYAYADPPNDTRPDWTFHRADGTRITSFPMTIARASVVHDASRTSAKIINAIQLGVKYDRTPVVVFSLIDKSVEPTLRTPVFREYRAGSWTAFNAPATAIAQILTTRYGKMLMWGGWDNKTNDHFVSADSGTTWFNVGKRYGWSRNYSAEYFNNTGHLLYRTFGDASGGRLVARKVYVDWNDQTPDY